MIALVLTLTLGSIAEPPPSMRLLPETFELAQADALEREQELERKIANLNAQIRAINTDWPPGAVVLSVVGYILSPFLLIGLPLMLVASVAGPGANVLLAIGIGTTVLGAVGLGCLIAGIVSGLNSQADARAERERLMQERQALEAELNALRRSRNESVRAPSPVMVTLADF